MIRHAGAHDLPFLRDMLRHAYYARWGNEADVPLERYVAGWGRPGDAALVAIDEFQPVGAAWYRLFKEDEPGYGSVDPDTPELPFWLAVTELEHGEWLAGQERLEDAEPLLLEAREIFERLEATPWLERIDAARPALARIGAETD